ncbi:hypothetical protein KLEB273_gp161 [Bacillus phage vB_BauM_KLEB27-3]|nr:hypothetical protein KLEB273_gp161 [Bacillus phage vB_BauM_KLEB27-3]
MFFLMEIFVTREEKRMLEEYSQMMNDKNLLYHLRINARTRYNNLYNSVKQRTEKYEQLKIKKDDFKYEVVFNLKHEYKLSDDLAKQLVMSEEVSSKIDDDIIFAQHQGPDFWAKKIHDAFTKNLFEKDSFSTTCICGIQYEMVLKDQDGRIFDTIVQVKNVPLLKCPNCDDEIMLGHVSRMYASKIKEAFKNDLGVIDYGSEMA